MDIEPTTPTRLIHRLARRCGLSPDVERGAGLVEWLARIVLAVGFAVCGVGFFTVVFWFMSGVLIGAFVAAEVLPSNFVWSSGWWALTTACATTLTCLAVISFIWQELRQEMRVPSPRLRLRLPRGWMSARVRPEALALETAVRLAPVADLDRRDASLEHHRHGWTLHMPLRDGAHVQVTLAGWPERPSVELTSGGEAREPVSRLFALGPASQATRQLWRLVDGLVARIGREHAGHHTAVPQDRHPLVLETIDSPSGAALSSDVALEAIDVQRHQAIEAAGLGEPPALAVRCAWGVLAAVPPLLALVATGYVAAHVPAGLTFGAVPVVLLTATLLALPGLELLRAVSTPALSVEHTGRQQVVLAAGRLWLEHDDSRVVDLHAPFSLSLTRDPATTDDALTWLGVEVRQRRSAGAPISIGLRVAARRTPAVDALARYALAAPEVDARLFAERLWPAIIAGHQLQTPRAGQRH